MCFSKNQQEANANAADAANETPPQSIEIDEEMNEFLDHSWSMLKTWYSESQTDNHPVITPQNPEVLRKALKLTIDDTKSGTFDEMKELLENVMKYSVRTSHPRFMNMLFGTTDIIGILGEVVVAFCNSSMYTYESSPVFTLMENEVMRILCGYVGWTDYKTQGSGIFAPGGSICNLYALSLARDNVDPMIKYDGYGGRTLVCYTSAECHYSIQKSANTIGIGMNNVIRIPVNGQGQMSPKALDEAIQRTKDDGKIPFMVNSTAGTTVRGAFDDIHAIADVAEKHGVWFHVDAAWGGSILMSTNHKHLISGIERADSVTWDPHKGMGVPLQCAVILTREKGKLMQQFEYKAEYLFKDQNLQGIVDGGGCNPQVKNALLELEEKPFDLGDSTVQCSRRIDCMKIWLMFKKYGKEYFSNRLDNAFSNKVHMLKQMKAKSDRFKLVSDPMYLNICFWYVPPCVRGKDFDDPITRKQIDCTVQSIRRSLMDEGSMYINYQPQGDLPNFFRPILNSGNTTKEDIDLMLSRIEHFGEQFTTVIGEQ